MDTISSSVSSLNLPSLQPPISRELRRLKATTTTTNKPTATKSIFSNKPSSCPSSSSFTRKNPKFQTPIFSTSSIPSKSRHTHKNPATGYAAALISISQSKDCLGKTQKEVQRLSRFLEGFLGEEDKREMVKEVAQRGKFGKYVMGLVRMLVETGKVGILGEVVEELEKIYDEPVGTKVVWDSLRKKMEEGELFENAKRVQKISGEKVKLRNFVDERLPVAVPMSSPLRNHVIQSMSKNYDFNLEKNVTFACLMTLINSSFVAE